MNALITGGAKGLGKAFSEAILRKGGKVCVADFNDLGQNTVDKFNNEFGKGKAIFVKCDVTRMEELKNAFEETKKAFQTIDVVCNNAGILHEGQWKKMLDINLVAVIQGTHLALEYMRKDKGGAGGLIVNVASMAGLLCVPESPVYAASKHGVLGFSRSLGTHPEVLSQGVRVNCLCPSFTDTDIIKVTPEQTSGNMDAYKSLGLLQPELVAEAFMWLVEDKSQQGAVLTVTTQKGIAYKKYAKM